MRARRARRREVRAELPAAPATPRPHQLHHRLDRFGAREGIGLDESDFQRRVSASDSGHVSRHAIGRRLERRTSAHARSARDPRFIHCQVAELTARVFDRLDRIKARSDRRLHAARISRTPEFLYRSRFQRSLDLPRRQRAERAGPDECVICVGANDGWCRRLCVLRIELEDRDDRPRPRPLFRICEKLQVINGARSRRKPDAIG